MILKKSDTLIRRAHFAHKHNPDHSCNPETLLHLLFKDKFHEILTKKINDKHNLKFNWSCVKCSGKHSGDLLKKALKVEKEYSLLKAKPDILLFDKDNKPYCAIEIIVTHDVEPETLSYYKANHIYVIKYILKSDLVLDEIDSKILNPDSVNLCTEKQCPKCENLLKKTDIIIFEHNCWRCGKTTKSAIIEENRGGRSGPDVFTSKELETAMKNGVKIEMKFSKTENRSYLANVCCHCNSIIGNFFLTSEYNKSNKIEYFETGLTCLSCEFIEKAINSNSYITKEDMVNRMMGGSFW